MTTATKAKRFLAAVVLGSATGPVWAQGFGAPVGPTAAPPQEVSVSQLFQGLGGRTGSDPAAPEAAGGIRWKTETMAAYKEAAGQGKPLVLFFSNDRCDECRGVCKTSQEVVRSFADPRMTAMADRAVFLRLDHGRLTADEQRAFKVLEIKTLPTVVMLDTRNGKLNEVGRIVGSFPADAFFAKFSDLMTRYAGNGSPAPAEAPRPPAPPKPPVSGTALPPAPAGTLTPESLPSFLAGLGYEVKSSTSPSGVLHCVVTARRGDWTLMFDMSFSKSGEILWIVAPLGRPLPANGGLSAATLVNLLMTNDDIGPVHFSVNRTDRRLYLNLAVTNQGVTPDLLRARIEFFLNQIMQSRDLWAAAGTSPAAPPPPVAPQ